jgi:hypothetical protein
MKLILLVILGVVAIAIRLLGLLPWDGGNPQRRRAVGSRFLWGLGVTCLVVIFIWFWLVMRPR